VRASSRRTRSGRVPALMAATLTAGAGVPTAGAPGVMRETRPGKGVVLRRI